MSVSHMEVLARFLLPAFPHIEINGNHVGVSRSAIEPYKARWIDDNRTLSKACGIIVTGRGKKALGGLRAG